MEVEGFKNGNDPRRVAFQLAGMFIAFAKAVVMIC
jgi:hypothetical protein